MNHPFLRHADRLVMLLLAALAFGLACTPIWDWDIWWHLKTGQLILERGQVPQVDWYTYGSAGEAWIDLHWGFQILVALLHRFGGLDLLVLAASFLIAALVVLGWTTSGRDLPTWLKVVVWLPALLCLDSRVFIRPELLSFLFLASWLFVLRHLLPRDRRYAWLLPLIQLLWVNCHGLFVLGLVVYIAFLASTVAEKFFPRLESNPRLRWKELAVLAAALVAAAFCNPYLDKGATFPLVLYSRFSGDFYPIWVGEFLPFLDCIEQYGLLDLPLLSELVLFSICLCSFLMLWKVRKVNIFRLILFAAFVHLAWVGWRNVAVFALVAGIIACWNFSDWYAWRRVDVAQNNSRDQIPQTVSLWPTLVATAVPTLLCLLVFTGNSSFFAFSRANIGLGERENRFIHDASRFAGQEGFPKKAFMPWHHAGVYIFHNGPEYKVFMDGRLEVNTREAFERHNYALQQMALGDPAWVSAVMGKDGELPVVILDRMDSGNEIQGLLRIPGWVPVYADPVAIVFVPSAVAARLRLPAIPLQAIFQQ